jgi:hypothetical protein
MPFEIQKAGKDSYYVVTIDTGKKHSSRPIPYEKALAQLQILESAYRKEKK